jgi:hypothetical protein
VWFRDVLQHVIERLVGEAVAYRVRLRPQFGELCLELPVFFTGVFWPFVCVPLPLERFPEFT